LGHMLSAFPSVLASWVRVLLDAVEAEGGNVPALLRAAGFAPDALRDPNARHSIYDVSRLWHTASEMIGDPAFALRVPLHVRHTTFHALGPAVLASSTLAEALSRAIRYRRLMTDSGTLRLERAGNQAWLRIVPNLAHTQKAEPFRDSILALTFLMLRALAGASFQLRSVTLHRAATTDLTPHAELFGCPVERAAQDILRFDAALLELPLPNSNPDLVRHAEGGVREYLSRLDSGSIVDRARQAIDDCESGQLSPELVARKLGMSLRSLQRSLRECGSSYEKLLRDGRRELACSYLRDGRHSVTQTAFALGYESSSAFARAFKRWTGQLPSEYAHGVGASKRGAC
ncbi:MAG: AraC family transcriptional regulator, partial [Polyangiales bacterium]